MLSINRLSARSTGYTTNRTAYRVGALLVTGAACWISGCAKSTDTPTTTASSGTPTADTKLSVVYIPKSTGNAYFNPVIDGFKKACSEEGMDFTTQAPATADATSQIPIIEQQIQLGVSAIALSPNSPDALKPVLKEAKSKGIKVVTIDADVDGGAETRDAVVLPVDFSIIGKSQVELMSSLMGGKGDFAILSATTDAPNQNAWIKDMKETLKDPKYKDMKLVEVVYGNDDPQKSQSETEALLTKYPNLTGIIAPTTVGISNAARALQTAGASKRVHLTGLGLPKQMSSFVKDGTVSKFLLWDPGKMGYAAGYLIEGLLKGNVKTTKGSTIKVGKSDELKFGDNGTLVAGPPLVFDSKNVNQYQF